MSSSLRRLWRWLTTYDGLTRWPTTPEAWLVAARDMQARMQRAAIEVAEEIGAHDLAEQGREARTEVFPAAEYLQELNRRQRGAGNRAVERARKMRRR